MAYSYKLIQATTSTSTSVTFSSIPATYTDLKLVISVRNDDVDAFDGMYMTLNGSTSNFSNKNAQGVGSGTPNSSSIARYVGVMNGAASSGSVFSSAEIYFPNYASSNYKSFSNESVSENNATLSFAEFGASLWSDTAAITSITLAFSSGPYASSSNFYLYGISNS